MSLYGHVKRIGSSQFQFDRIYDNRKQMDDACTEGDGVYIGRYVLVEYGERYEAEVVLGDNGDPILDENGKPKVRFEYIKNSITGEQTYTQNSIGEEVKEIVSEDYEPSDDEDIVVIDDVRYKKFKVSRPVLKETSNFKANRMADETAYGNSYDSTVWQKIYIGGEERYRMIAELNAIVPQLEIIPEGGTIYYASDDPAKQTEVYDAFNNLITGIAETVNEPSFDTTMDTELAYRMHYPKPLQLHVTSDGMNFNQEGFVVPYAAQKDNSESYIRWITDNFYGKNYNEDGEEVTASDGEAAYKKTSLSTFIDSKTLKMNLPIFGNTIIDLLNLLYGAPDTDEEGNILGDAIRPYFAPYRDSEKYIYKLDQNGMVIGYLAPAEAQGDPWYYVVPPEEQEVQEDNSIRILRTANNDFLDNYYWLKKVPGIGDILANNTSGIVDILTRLFATQNPLTGTVKYWMFNDWTAEDYSEDKNTPTILNKPTVVTYGNTYTIPNLEENFKSLESSIRLNISNGKHFYKIASSAAYDDLISHLNYGDQTVEPNSYYYIDGTQELYRATDEHHLVGVSVADYVMTVKEKNIYKGTEGFEYYEKYAKPADINPGDWYIDFSSWKLRPYKELETKLENGEYDSLGNFHQTPYVSLRFMQITEVRDKTTSDAHPNTPFANTDYYMQIVKDRVKYILLGSNESKFEAYKNQLNEVIAVPEEAEFNEDYANEEKYWEIQSGSGASTIYRKAPGITAENWEDHVNTLYLFNPTSDTDYDSSKIYFILSSNEMKNVMNAINYNTLWTKQYNDDRKIYIDSKNPGDYIKVGNDE